MPSAEEIVGEIEDFYRAYIDAFNREDIDSYADSFVPGYSLIHGAKITAYATEPELQQYSAQAFIDLKSRGWARSAVDLLKVSPLGDDQAMILAEVTRYRADESVLLHARVSYIVIRTAKGWKIAVMIPLAEPSLGPGDLPR
ncbi:MAG: nuclear transport factor 2 family protein [Candidatus Binataceae bacterium]